MCDFRKASASRNVSIKAALFPVKKNNNILLTNAAEEDVSTADSDAMLIMPGEGEQEVKVEKKTISQSQINSHKKNNSLQGLLVPLFPLHRRHVVHQGDGRGKGQGGVRQDNNQVRE